MSPPPPPPPPGAIPCDQSEVTCSWLLAPSLCLSPHLSLSPELRPRCPSRVYFRDYEHSALRHLKCVWHPGSSPQRVQFLRFLPIILILKRKAQISLAVRATVTTQSHPSSVTLPTRVASSAWIPWSLHPLLPSGFGVVSSHERMFPGTECLGFFHKHITRIREWLLES